MKKLLGVAHFVARVVTEQGMNLEFYLEKSEPIISYLKRLSADPNRQLAAVRGYNANMKVTSGHERALRKTVKLNSFC